MSVAPERAQKPRLLFVSPVFLFPNDTGGRIRTTNILRGMKGGGFEIVLASPAADIDLIKWKRSISEVCDTFLPWQGRRPGARWKRVLDLLDPLPFNVVADRTDAGRAAVEAAFSAAQIDLVVFDFVHSLVLRPDRVASPTVCFTHNVEAEIFERHAQSETRRIPRLVWTRQALKMRRFEATALTACDRVIAVSERDADRFRKDYGIAAPAVIPTGVDLDYFAWQPSPPIGEAARPSVVFTGSMDWTPNVDGIEWFLEDVWPRVLSRRPDARFIVVGRSPPPRLVERHAGRPDVRFTGFVDDVRPFVRNAHAFVIPLRIGGGTRIKAFEAMAMGCPVVSTTLGVEGLGLSPQEQCLVADSPSSVADAILGLLADASFRSAMSVRAREWVEQRYGHRVVAGVFESICWEALGRRESGASLQRR